MQWSVETSGCVNPTDDHPLHHPLEDALQHPLQDYFPSSQNNERNHVQNNEEDNEPHHNDEPFKAIIAIDFGTDGCGILLSHSPISVNFSAQTNVHTQKNVEKNRSRIFHSRK